MANWAELRTYKGDRELRNPGRRVLDWGQIETSSTKRCQMSSIDPQMETEYRDAPEAVRRQGLAIVAPLNELLRRIKAAPPSFVMTCARGSSAHAATFAKYLIERYLGLPVAAMAPSIATLYRQRLRLEGQLFLAISQSGYSDDLVE